MSKRETTARGGCPRAMALIPLTARLGVFRNYSEAKKGKTIRGAVRNWKRTRNDRNSVMRGKPGYEEPQFTGGRPNT